MLGIGVGEPIFNFTSALSHLRKSLAGEFVYGYDESNPALLTKMTGPAHEVETSYEPHRNLNTGVVNRSRFAAEVGGRKSEVGGDAGAPVAPAPAAGSGPSTKDQALRTVSSYTYANDLLGRRETISQGGEAFGMLKLGANRVEIAYNDRSEVVGAAYGSGGEVRQRFGYDYDAIGNRQRAASEVGGRKSEVSYEVNTLNQYEKISENQRSSAVRYDLDGNLLEDARNTYTWNADNNLIRVESKDGTLRLDYVYDHQSRRTVRTETTNPGKDTESRRTTYYLYDDWNLVADVSAVTGHGSRVTGEEADAVRYYTWGRDLSGSLQGAGGVGGLLAISKGAAHRFPTYDANGNIGQLIDGAGAVVAAYAYDPFGNVTEMAGAEAAENPWRFSTKPVEAGTGWLYYGYRWYDAEMGRWVNRDPIEESGGVNLYGFVGNDGVGMVDVLGHGYVIPIALVILIEALLHDYLSYKSFDVFPECDDPPVENDKNRHCWVNCVSTRIHLGGIAAALAASLFKEARDLGEGDPWSWSVDDMKANAIGMIMALNLDASCKENCENAYPCDECNEYLPNPRTFPSFL